MRGFLSRHDAPLGRVLIVESCPRETCELLLARLPDELGGTVDVLTCYESAPENFNAERGTLYSVHQSEAKSNRGAFLEGLARGDHDAVVIVCAGSGVLAPWKWAIAAKSRAPLVIADEFGEWFTVNYRNLTSMIVLAVRRTNVAGVPQLLSKLVQFFLAPFTLLYLVFYALAVHIRRRIRLWKRATS